MASQKPSIPKGTRDFPPLEMNRRNYIFDTIRRVFRKYGFLPLETPSMENLSTLTGKYGEEGDQLIFKILNSGDFLNGVAPELLNDAKKLTGSISEKALRYDLTVPFARFVVMNQHAITFPFRRYQIQPVWRADRPQKGRYREFYQCDADVIGTDSLLCEAELVMIYDEALTALGLPSFTIKLNNRKVLYGMAETIGETGKLVDITVAIDKLDKIGLDGVKKELVSKGISEDRLERLVPFIGITGSTEEKLNQLKQILAGSETGMKGIAEMEEVLRLLKVYTFRNGTLELDFSLARGLNYYTGAIFEVKAHGVSIGSIGGGGRYDDLTGIFGLPGMSGVGISFGADRIYDVMAELNLFQPGMENVTRLLITNFDEGSAYEAFRIATQLRGVGIATEVYPSAAKLKKQMSYADSLKIPYVLLVGSEEISKQQYTLKDMQSGDQSQLTVEQLMQQLR